MTKRRKNGPGPRGYKRLTPVLMSDLALVLLAGSAQALAQQPAQPRVPNTSLQYGFTMALLGNNTVVRGMGFQWVSYTLGWDSAEPSQGVYDWGNADNIANGARNARSE